MNFAANPRDSAPNHPPSLRCQVVSSQYPHRWPPKMLQDWRLNSCRKGLATLCLMHFWRVPPYFFETRGVRLGNCWGGETYNLTSQLVSTWKLSQTSSVMVCSTWMRGFTLQRFGIDSESIPNNSTEMHHFKNICLKAR